MDTIFSVRRELTTVAHSEFSRDEVLALLRAVHPGRDYSQSDDEQLAEEFEWEIGSATLITDQVVEREWSEVKDVTESVTVGATGYLR